MFYQYVTRGDFHDAFRKLRPDNFSHEGLNALYDWCEEIGQGDNFEFDVIGLCCDFTEYEDFEEFIGEHAYNSDEWTSWEDIEEAATVIRVGGSGAIVQNI